MKTRACGPLASLLLAGLLLGADDAVAAKVRSAHDPSFDFSKVETYSFKLSGTRNENLDGRILAEIRKELAKKGLQELPADSEELPDVFVNYAVGTIDTLAPGFVIQPGWYGEPWAVPGAYSAVTGGLLIEMGDPETGNLVWDAAYVMKGNNPNALLVMASKVEKAVRGALAKYPP